MGDANYLKQAVQLAWPITVILIVMIFYRPLYRLLYNFAKKMVEIERIKIGNIEFSAPELEQVIIEREILKIGIIIGSSDKDLNEEELNYLETRAISMGGDPQNLSSEAREKIIKQAILIATADKKITYHEYQELKRIAFKYAIPSDDVDNMFFDCCDQLRTKLPPELQNKHKEYLSKLNS